MKQSYLFFALLTACFIFIVSCSKEDEIKSVDFIKFSISELCAGSALKSSTEKERTIIIMSEQMQSKETGCLSTPPQVDFNTHFVLAGRVAFDNCAKLKEETIVDMGNILRYHVQITQSECQKIDTVYFMAAVPIRYKDHQIDFDITY